LEENYDEEEDDDSPNYEEDFQVKTNLNKHLKKNYIVK
jgi:hypothetical protein